MSKLLKLDHYQQTTDYTCGPAALMSFLSYHDKKFVTHLTEMKLARNLKTTSHFGTWPHQLLRQALQTGKHFALTRNASLNDIRKNIDAERPSIVLWHDDEELHWSTLVGYDDQHIILLDPYLQEGFHAISNERFNQSWKKLLIV